MSENRKSSEVELEMEEKLKLIFSKAKELCNLVRTMYCDMCITINGDNFWISQLYDHDSSFVDESDNTKIVKYSVLRIKKKSLPRWI